MALGSTIQGLSGVGSGAFFSIQANSGQEWVVHNIYHQAGVHLQWYNGTNVLSFTSIASANVETNLQFHVTNSIYIRVQNTTTASQFIGYDAIQTNSA